MIGGWRKVWGQGDFPFLFVQIAPHNGMSPEIREAQRLTTETTPNTAMAVITDVGDAVDIHPRQKQPVGIRLACGRSGARLWRADRVLGTDARWHDASPATARS